MATSEFIKAFSVFRNSPEGLTQNLRAVSRRQRIPAGRQTYREDDACSAIAFVLSGEIRVHKIGQTAPARPASGTRLVFLSARAILPMPRPLPTQTCC